MHEHELRAEYAPAVESQDDPLARDLGPVRNWHMVRDAETTAMCGRELRPQAAVKPENDWGRTRERCCHTCGALYLREVPFLHEVP